MPVVGVKLYFHNSTLVGQPVHAWGAYGWEMLHRIDNMDEQVILTPSGEPEPQTQWGL